MAGSGVILRGNYRPSKLLGVKIEFSFAFEASGGIKIEMAKMITSGYVIACDTMHANSVIIFKYEYDNVTGFLNKIQGLPESPLGAGEGG